MKDGASSSFNRNPTGKNQHQRRSPEEEQIVTDALHRYHKEKIVSNDKISARLETEHGFRLSASSIKRLRRDLGLNGSRSQAIKSIDKSEAEQLVLDHLSVDVAQRCGVQTIQAKIAYKDGIHLPRHFVSEVMHIHAPDGFDLREPTAKKIFRVQKVPLGIHHRWAGDGHDKLYKIGFPVYAVVDDATAKYLGAWVVPSNRMGYIVAYLFLSLVEKYGGIPLQFTSDGGSETTVVYGLINAMRDIFYPEVPTNEVPAHLFLRSIHNVSIERSWLRLRLEMGDTTVLHFNKGLEDGTYDPDDKVQFQLCKWLWSRLVQRELDEFVDFRNGVRMRRDNKKAGPSGMSRNDAFSMHESWGGRNYLMPVDVDVVKRIKEAIGGEELLAFTSDEFSAKAQGVLDSLNTTMADVTLLNAWDVFRAMLPSFTDE